MKICTIRWRLDFQAKYDTYLLEARKKKRGREPNEVEQKKRGREPNRR